MNPMISGIIMAFVRYLLAGAMTALVTRGVLTPDQTDYIIAGTAGFIAVVVWAAWVKYRDRLKLTTAMAIAPVVTENIVEAHVEAGHAPSVTLPKDAPVPPIR